MVFTSMIFHGDDECENTSVLLPLDFKNYRKTEQGILPKLLLKLTSLSQEGPKCRNLTCETKH